MPGPDDFVLTREFRAPPETVYRAVATREGIAGWWTRAVRFDDRVGSLAEMRFDKAGFWARFRVAALEPPRRVQWECVDSQHPEKSGFSDLKEWNGTRVRFEIEPAGEGSARLRFTHEGLVPKLECNDSCRSIWSFYIDQSLRALVETGTGDPYFE